jgi:predicted Zn-dependent peptidase
MEETRHVASWLGVQEALHERVLSVDEVLAELNAVTPADIQALAQRLVRDDGLCLAVISPGRVASRLERTLKLD